jgi:hypothetical protein
MLTYIEHLASVYQNGIAGQRHAIKKNEIEKQGSMKCMELKNKNEGERQGSMKRDRDQLNGVCGMWLREAYRCHPPAYRIS